MKAKWQKIICKALDMPHLFDLKMWAKVERPRNARGTDVRGAVCMVKGYTINLCSMDGVLGVLDASGVEFLARGPEDFAESVEMVPYEVWSSPDWKGAA